MTTLADVHESLAAAVEVAGLTCEPYEKTSINPPCAHVVAPAYDPRLVLSGAKQAYPFKVRVYGSFTTPEATIKAMSPYRDAHGSQSLVLAIQDGDNWSATVDYAQVQQVGEWQVAEAPPGSGSFYLYFELDVEVLF